MEEQEQTEQSEPNTDAAPAADAVYECPMPAPEQFEARVTELSTAARSFVIATVPTIVSPEHMDVLTEPLKVGAERAGRSLADIDIAPTASANITDDVAAARDTMRPYLALYIGGMGSKTKNFYNEVVQRYGFEDAARTVQDLYLDGKKDEAAAAIPDELIDSVSLCGSADRVRDQLRLYRAAGVGTLIITPMAWSREDRIKQLRLIAELNDEAR